MLAVLSGAYVWVSQQNVARVINLEDDSEEDEHY